MKIPLFQAFQFIVYFLKKEDIHSLHSPFVYQVYEGLKKYRIHTQNNFPEIDQMRRLLSENDSRLMVKDPGAGSHQFSSAERKISDILQYSTSTRKYALLYQFFCTLTPARIVLELGTCLGINSLCLAEVTLGKLYTFEGSDALIIQAKKNIQPNNKIHLVPGNISETLPAFLRGNAPIDFAFLDANHTYRHTMSYFRQLMDHSHENTIIVVGDIHWSKGMHRAWKEIIRMDLVRLSLDFFECGVLFFRKGLEKEHYVLHY